MLRLALLGALVQRTAAAPYREENARWNVNFERRHSPKDYYGSWENHRYFPSPADWRALAIYQLITDRFADGDPRNNELHNSDFDVRDMTYRHGGDFVGLTRKLPYIKGLGCQAIWISPVFLNGPNSYHQYAMHDFTLIDPRLGTLEELRALTTAAHELGMYVVVDVVMNHMDNLFAFEGHERGGTPFKMHEDQEYRLVLRSPDGQMFDTPAGPQPYEDFWHNNTWDPQGTYGGPVYGKWGETAVDDGRGTYTWSDFHHNGDLTDFTSPWQITTGKIYGTMDDLRLESQRVQDKYIAMTLALITSVDVDGFRVDTPMQVPLEFFKRWAPAVRAHARSLGKERFGLFGEFFVEPARFATMTGRGKTPDMYDTETFLAGDATMKGGIDYSYYWYLFTTLVHRLPEYTDGLALTYQEEGRMLDTVEPSTGAREYAMWTFCNNHDNWRMQTMAGPSQFTLCLAVISFWPGTPLHYAGDEQALNTPGSALDGWAREELSVSLAWRAIRTAANGNPADRDNFDMTSPSYRYLQRLNALRRAYFGGFGSPACDVMDVKQSSGMHEVLVFSRGCTEDARVLVVANFHPTEARSVTFPTPWPKGTHLVDALLTAPEADTWALEVQIRSRISVVLQPLQVRVLVPGPVRQLPPTVAAVSPAHGAAVGALAGGTLNITLRFDRAMDTRAAEAAVMLDGVLLSTRPGGGAACVEEAAVGCLAVSAQVALGDLSDGAHRIEVIEGVPATDGVVTPSAFQSMFFVNRTSSLLVDSAMHEQPGLICNYLTQLCHSVHGAEWFRVQNLGGAWSTWQSYQPVTYWQAEPGRAVLVQYHAEGSSSYVAADCVQEGGHRCYASWHGEMFLRTDGNKWGMQDEGRMVRLDHFTWGVNMSFDGYVGAKFAPFPNWDKSYGRMKDRDFLYNLPVFDARHAEFWVGSFFDGTEAIRDWMVQRGFWSPHESIASGHSSAVPIWLGHLCDQKPPFPAGTPHTDWHCYQYGRGQNADWCRAAEDEAYTYAFNNRSHPMGECGDCECCRKAKALKKADHNSTCCILFNDLYLNYTVTPDLSRCQAVPIRPAPPGPRNGHLWIAMSMGVCWSCFPCLVAIVGVLRKKKQSVVRMLSSPDQVANAGKKAPQRVGFWARSPAGLAAALSSEPSAADLTPSGASASGGSQHEISIMKPHRVLFASLEHVIEHEGGREKAIAGGLGKVAGLMCRYHPGDLICVTASMPKREYPFARFVGQVEATVSREKLSCDVLRYDSHEPLVEVPRPAADGERPSAITYYIVDHPLFRARDDIYPAPQTRRRTLEFYSLWCQVVARIIDQVAPDAFHCPDFHAAMAVLYIERPLPVVTVLHNAEYQGAIATQHMGRREARHLASIFNLPASVIVQRTFIEGKFCMLKPIVDYVRQHQRGYGISAVSRNYALEASQKHAVLWDLPEVRGIENCMPETERLGTATTLGEEAYIRARAAAKRFVQEKYGLQQSADARIFIFLGRWVKQKGVDYIADVAEWMLSTYPNAQLLMIGPIGDSYGSYAKAKLDQLKRSGRFEESLFVHAGFLEVPQELKLACDFCLMPSRDEPFGYVDIEFAWFGAAVVGSLRGGLGKLPGFYFQILNADSARHMQKALMKAIASAMACHVEVLAAMSLSARASAFPVANWQRELLDIYELALLKFYNTQMAVHVPPATPRGIAALCPVSARTAAAGKVGEARYGRLPEGEEFLRQEASEVEMQALVELKLAASKAPNAAALIEEVEWDRELSQEAGLARLLGRTVCGAPILDWVICMAYMSGPLMPALTLAHVGTSAKDAQAFAVLRPAAQAFGLVFWTLAAKAARPNILMATALLARLLPLALPFVHAPPRFAAIALGLVGPSDYLFLYYSFMGSSVGDVARLAMRTGLIMAVREQWEPLFMTLAESPHPMEYSLTAEFAVLFVVLPAFALCKAPMLYRVFSVPELSFAWVRKLHFLLLLGAATVFEAFSHSSTASTLVLRQMRPFHLDCIRVYCFLLAATAAVPMAILGLVLRRFPSYAVVMVKAFACCSLPAAVLQCWSQAEVDRAQQLVVGLDALIFTSAVVGALAAYASAVAVLATVGSRWRFVSYTCAVGVSCNIARAASFAVVAHVTGEPTALHTAAQHGLPAQFARRLLLVVVPASGAALLMKFAAFFYFEKEATGMLRTKRHKSLMRLAHATEVASLPTLLGSKVAEKPAVAAPKGAGPDTPDPTASPCSGGSLASNHAPVVPESNLQEGGADAEVDICKVLEDEDGSDDVGRGPNEEVPPRKLRGVRLKAGSSNVMLDDKEGGGQLLPQQPPSSPQAWSEGPSGEPAAEPSPDCTPAVSGAAVRSIDETPSEDGVVASGVHVVFGRLFRRR